jgi:hypothetical protein
MPKSLLMTLLALPLLVGTMPPVPQADDFCRWESEGQYNRMERAIVQQIKRIKHGERVSNGNGGTYISHHQIITQVETWLNEMPCAEAMLDKCVAKIDLFPGSVTLGARYAHGTEMCYQIQMGKINRLNRWLGWMYYFKDSQKLVYKGSNPCPGFVDQQKAYCREWEAQHPSKPHNE